MIRLLCLSLFAASALAQAPIQPFGLHRFGAEIEFTPRQVAVIRERNPQAGLEVFVAFKQQLFAEPGAFSAFQKKKAGLSRAALRAEVLATLKTAAATSGTNFTNAPPEGFTLYGSYWLVNGVWGLAENEEVLGTLARRPDVRAIYRLARRRSGAGVPVPKALSAKASETEPAFEPGDRTLGVGLDMIRAPEVWAQHGFYGTGVVTAVIDSGVHPGAPDLRGAMWRNVADPINGRDDDGNGFVDDHFGINALKRNGDILPVADGRQKNTSHGTICGGLIAGRGTSGRITGVAPRSRVMACISQSALCIDSLQYALENGADIVSMSFMGEQPYLFRALWRLQAEHATAAGLFLCGGAGNFAQRPQYRDKPQIWIPKSIPCVMAGAGLDDQGARAPFSSLGPVSWEKVPGYGEALVRKPDVSTVSLQIHAIQFGDGKPERSASGNSFSGPQIAGCAALMFEANSALPPWAAMRIMRETAVDLGEPGWDAKFGYGRLDCLAAVERVLKNRKK